MTRRFGTVAVGILGGLCLLQGAVRAGDKVDQSAGARAAVETVLRRETLSTIDRRAELAPALSNEPDAELIRWHSGYVRSGDSWRSYDGRLTSTEQSRLAEYRQRRENAEPTPASQLEMANWCRQHGLRDQERSHLVTLLTLTPDTDQAATLQRLGYIEVGNQWVSLRQLREWAVRNRHAVAALKRWGTRLEKLSDQLQGGRRRREAAIVELNGIDSAEAIPALEYTLCGKDVDAAEQAVACFSGLQEAEATVALARQAVFSPWTEVRRKATTALQGRRLEDFVPTLISLLATPAQSAGTNTRVLWQGNRGILVYDYIVARETEQQFQAATLTTIDYRLNEALFVLVNTRTTIVRPMPTFNARTLLDREAVYRITQDAEREVAADRYRRSKVVEAVNDRTAELNTRIANVLGAVSQQEPAQDPHIWWKWWSTYRDVETPSKRTVRVNEEEFRGNVCTPPAAFITIIGPSCFSAGTAVWTETGPQPIEQIKAGDQVLAQDIETGELSLKPVLYTTVRPPRELKRVKFEGEFIDATGGHQFWISGAGWTKARDLKPGALIHTITGNQSVASVETGPVAPTYNLVVDDFHSYFVGSAGLLVQDSPMPISTNNVVPGLSRRQLAAGAKP